MINNSILMQWLAEHSSCRLASYLWSIVYDANPILSGPNDIIDHFSSYGLPLLDFWLPLIFFPIKDMEYIRPLLILSGVSTRGVLLCRSYSRRGRSH